MGTARPGLDVGRARESAQRCWDDSIVPALTDYIRIPNKSPGFDPDWEAHGHMERAVGLVSGWCRANAPAGATVDVHRLAGRTPLILVEVPGTDGTDDGDTVLLYGHLDKQPEMTGWREGLGPWTPVLEDGRLYGRGGADDGYAAFASLLALRLLDEQGVPRKRCVVLVEGCEESGSYDLPHHVEALAERIGSVSLVICLDSGCGNYDQLWTTTSLRGVAVGTLSVELLTEGVHSGAGSGVVASSFRVLRRLLDRIEDPDTGEILLRDLHVELPHARVEEARRAAHVLGATVGSAFPLKDGVRPVNDDPTALILNRTWRPALAVTGAGGLPSLADAGNVLRPITSVKLSMRLPPTADAAGAVESLRSTLERTPPYGATVRWHDAGGADGWDAPPTAPWLAAALSGASQAYFGRDVLSMGEGGTIPFMGMLGERFPQAQFVVTGVLGPGSNAHGPNEFLHLRAARDVTCCVAHVVGDHASR